MRTPLCLTVRTNISEEATLARDQNDALYWHNGAVMPGAIETNGVVFTLIILHSSPPNLWAGIWGGAHYRDDTQSWCDFLKEGDYVRGGEGRTCVCVCVCVLINCNITSLCHLHCYSRPCLAKGIWFFSLLCFLSRHVNVPLSVFTSCMADWNPSDTLQPLVRDEPALLILPARSRTTDCQQFFIYIPSFSLGHLNYFYIGVTNEGEKRS